METESQQGSEQAIKLNHELLATASGRRTVHFVHVKSHSDNEGNDCADVMRAGPYSRFKKVGGEGRGRFGPVEKDEKELGGAAVAGGNNIAAGGATDEGAGGSPERASGGGADGPALLASPATRRRRRTR